MYSEPQLIETTEDLNAALSKLSDAEFVAIDTEFMRESTYYPKLCLVQLSARRERHYVLTHWP